MPVRLAPPLRPGNPVVDALVLAALEEFGGPTLVLDDGLRVVAATPGAAELLGATIPLGVSAPKLLCGHAVQRPMAEALAAGRPVSVTIPRPRSGGGERIVRVRTVPLHRGVARVGWALLLAVDAGDPTAADAPVEFHGMWTRDVAMKRLFRLVERVARSDASVLVRGETGAGKELVAQALHALSPRHAGPFRAINCAALPPNLLESELFGHRRGAFTGAVRDTPGHFRLADKGTLFLDEIAELPLDLQAKMLRVLETRTVIPVGASEPVAFDARIIAATHRSLRHEVEAGRFRADLMYRLRVVPLFLPPLRARPGDVMLLVETFVRELNGRGGRQIERVAPGARQLLERYDWPGNVRELRNVLEYAAVVGEGAVLVEADLPPDFAEVPPVGEPEVALANADPVASAAVAGSPEVARLRRALERAGGNRERAAKALGISRVTLWRHMKAHGLEGADGEVIPPSKHSP